MINITKKIAVVIPFDYEIYFSRGKKEVDVNKLLTTYSSFHIQWAKSFRSSGFDTKLFYISSSDIEVQERIHKSGIKMISCPILFNFKSHKKNISLKMIESVRAFDPDLILIMDFSWLQSFIMTPLLSSSKCLIINRNAGSDIEKDLFADYNSYKLKNRDLNVSTDLNVLIKYFFYKYKIFTLPLKAYINQLITKLSFNYSSLTMIESKKDKYFITNKLLIDTNKVKFLPKPVDTKLFSNNDKNFCKKKIGLDIKDKFLLHVSNLYDTKGCEHIITVLPSLIKKYSDLKLIVVGEGPKKLMLENLAKSLKVGERVIFAGRIRHELLSFYYNASEAIILLSNRVSGEGRPNVLLEAISSYTPIISSNLQVIKSLVEPKFGYCINYADNQALIESIKKVLSGQFSLDKDEVAKFREMYSFKNTATAVVNAVSV